MQLSAARGKHALPAGIEGLNAPSRNRHRHHRGLPGQHGGHRLLGFAPRFAEHAELLSRRQYHALVYARHLQRIGNVRHQRHHAAGLLDVRLRPEERVDPLALAHLQPDISHGLPVRMAAPVQSNDWSGVDQDPLRHRPRRAVIAPYCRYLRLRQHHRLLQLRIQGHRQVCADVPALASVGQRVCPDSDRHYSHLRDQGRHDQRRDYRGRAVLHPVDRFVCRGHHRHGQGGAGYAAQGGACGVGQHLLRLAFEPGLVHAASGGQHQDCPGRLRAVRLLRHHAALQGHTHLRRRTRAQLRYAARAFSQRPA